MLWKIFSLADLPLQVMMPDQHSLLLFAFCYSLVYGGLGIILQKISEILAARGGEILQVGNKNIITATTLTYNRFISSSPTPGQDLHRESASRRRAATTYILLHILFCSILFLPIIYLPQQLIRRKNILCKITLPVRKITAFSLQEHIRILNHLLFSIDAITQR